MSILNNWKMKQEAEQLRLATEIQALKNHQAAQELVKESIAVELKMVAEANNVFATRDNTSLFDAYQYQTGDAIDESNFLTMQRNHYKLWSTSGMPHGWIEKAVHYIVGAECKLEAMDEDEATQDVLDEWCEGLYDEETGTFEKPWAFRAQEAVRRFLRDGEFFWLFAVKGGTGDVYCRFMNPFYIRSSRGATDSFGIETDAHDVERVVSYSYWPTFNMGKANEAIIYYPWNPNEKNGVIHAKLNDSDAKRGRPWLQPILSDLREFDELMRSRQTLHWLRTQCYREEIYQGGWKQLLDQVHTDKKAKNLNTSGVLERAPTRGSIDRHTANVEVNYKTPNLQAIDADTDIRRFGLKFSVALNMPEHWILGDASNNNYASGELSETPGERCMKYWQMMIAPHFERIGSIVIREAIKAGKLDAYSKKSVRKLSADGVASVEEITVPRSTKVSADFPRLKDRDILRESQAVILQKESGLISLETARTDLDRDSREEQLQINIERKAEEEDRQLYPSQYGMNGSPLDAGNMGVGPSNGKPGSEDPNASRGVKARRQVNKIAPVRP